MKKQASRPLSDRQEIILEALIRRHTRTARPIGSVELMRRIRLDASPATVRNELSALCDDGYLEQPHTSAGRVPTDKGYRFFVDHLAEEAKLSEREEALLRRTFSLRGEEEFLHEFGLVLARVSGMFAAVGLCGRGFLYETGFSEVADEPEFADRNTIREFSALVDRIGSNVDDLFDLASSDGKIFIGEENPWGFGSCSLVFSWWEHPRGFRGYLALVGPKRTNYEKHQAVVKRIRVIPGKE